MKEPFWRRFMYQICDAIGIKPDHVSQITIDVGPGTLPMIVIKQICFEEGQMRKALDAFEAVEYKSVRSQCIDSSSQTLEERRIAITSQIKQAIDADQIANELCDRWDSMSKADLVAFLADKLRK